MKLTDKLADYIYQHQFNLQQLTIIVPNERAVKFIAASLFTKYQKPIFSPRILTIDKWIRMVCPKNVIDKTRLLIELYHVQATNPIDQGELSFDQFMTWGQILLQDFDEIDRYLLDHTTVFKNLKDIRELESWNVEPEELTVTQQKFMAFWEKLPDYYTRLNEILDAKNALYSGKAYRWLADNLPSVFGGIKETSAEFIFIGFNALSKAEMSIIKQMRSLFGAHVLIDADRFYLDQEMHEAGSFLRKFMHELEVKELPFINDDLISSSKKIKLIESTQYTGQVKIAASVLSELTTEELNETLVLLADEGLVIPMLRNIPKIVGKANITLGLPLKSTPAKSWVELLFRIQENKKRFGDKVIYFNDLQQFMNHPFIQISSDVTEKEQLATLEYQSKKFNRIVQKIENLELSSRIHSLLELVCKEWKMDWLFAINTIRELNQALYASFSPDHLFERAVVQSFDSSLIELENIASEGFPELGLKSFALIFKNHAYTRNIAYHGNPIEGLQIMGLLETRMLDFKRIIVLGLNEGSMPPSNVIQTFIPIDLRRYLGLPLPRDKQGLFAHHFYRLLHQSTELYITYCSSGEAIGGAEPSRYILQLEMELARLNKNVVITKEHYHIPEEENTILNDEIQKDEFYFKRLDDFFSKPLSASAINRYLACPMDFYYRYILEFGEEENLEEEVASNTIGSFIHTVLEELYLPFAYLDKSGNIKLTERKYLTITDIDEMLLNYERLIRIQYLKHFENNAAAFETGKNLISYKMAIELTKKILEAERLEIHTTGISRWIYQLEGLLYSSIEIDLNGEKKTILFKGFVDRIDGVGDAMRIIDYKSGKVKAEHVKFALGKDGDVIKAFHNTKHGVQLVLYCILFKEKFGHLPQEAAIASLVNIKDGLFSLNSDKMSVQEIVDLFPKLLGQIIKELYDPSIPIKHESESKYCNFC
jgi:CRISPR/Cas system-associated exonuclease Cas4 (RecB family)